MTLTFASLHDGIEEGCDCLLQEGSNQEFAGKCFARMVEGNQITDQDFKSHHERSLPRELKKCIDHCKYRGVSIDLVSEKEEAKVVNKYKMIVSTSPLGFPRYYCRFRLLEQAGRVWDTRTNKNPAHHTLLKADGFSLSHVEVVEITALV